jgi:hypothetical protein
MYIFTVFIFPRALVSLLAVGDTRKRDELVGNFVFWGWKGVSRVRFDYLWILYHHPSAVVERERALGLECLFVCCGISLFVIISRLLWGCN